MEAVEAAPWDPGLGSGVVSMLSMTAPPPLVDMGLRGSTCRRERPVDDGFRTARVWRGRCSAVLAGALAAGR